MEKLYTSKTFSKMPGERMRTPQPTPLNPPLAISYRNHQKSLAYFSFLAPLVLFSFTKSQSQKRGMGAWHNATPIYAPGSERVIADTIELETLVDVFKLKSQMRIKL